MRASQLLGLLFVAGCTYDYQGALGSQTSGASSSASSGSAGAGGGSGGIGGIGGIGGVGGAASSSASSTGGGPASASSSISSSASSGTGGGTIGRCFNGCPAKALVRMHANTVDNEVSGTSGVKWQAVNATWAVALESYDDSDGMPGESDDSKLEATIVNGKPHTDNIVASAFDAGCFPAGAAIASVDLVALRRASNDGSATDAAVTIAIGGGTPNQLATYDWSHGTTPLFASRTWTAVISPTVSQLPSLVVKMRAAALASHMPTLDVDDIHIDVHLQGCPP